MVARKSWLKSENWNFTPRKPFGKSLVPSLFAFLLFSSLPLGLAQPVETASPSATPVLNQAPVAVHDDPNAPPAADETPLSGEPVQQPIEKNAFQALQDLKIIPIDGTDPAAAVSRGQLAGVLLRAFRFNTDFVSEYPFFRDVSRSHPAYVPIEVVREKGLMSGLPGGFYKPDKLLTRLDSLVILAGALPPMTLPEEDIREALAPLPDANTVPDWARVDVAKGVRLKMTPLRNGRLDLKEPVTQGELAEMLKVVLIQTGSNLFAVRPDVKAYPALPPALSLVVSPTGALFANNMAVGNTVYFATTQPITNGVNLPRGTRVRGQVIDAIFENTWDIVFNEAETPAGQHFRTVAALRLQFPVERKTNGLIVPGQTFTVQTTAVEPDEPTSDAATP